MKKTVAIGLVIGLITSSRLAAEDLVFENSRFRAVLGEDAVWMSLMDKTASVEYCAAKKRVTFASVLVKGKTRNANHAQLVDGRLAVDFEGCDVRLFYKVTSTDDWIAFQLTEVSGKRPIYITLMRIGVTISERGGSRLNAAWNDRYTICLRGISLKSQGSLSRRSDHTLLKVTTQDVPGPKLEGAGAALIAARTRDARSILQRLSEAYDLVRNERGGVPSRELPIARQSYWFLSFGEKDVEKVINYCQKTGFRQVMINSDAWCASVGHYTFKKDRYPDGIESLRRTVATLHEHGILAGMHTFASKVSKRDPYVTPVPNRGFWVDRSATLAVDGAAGETRIQTADDLSQWPGSPVCERKVWEGHVSKHQEVIIDNEIIRYESIGPEGEWDTFLGCERGAWGTRAAAHNAGTECRHYGVDGCINGYIIDQESPLFKKTTSRLAHIFNYCDFDMVYFDGSEDVDRRRYHYYASNAHAVPMRKFKKRPVIHMGGGRTHGLWHSFTRYGTIDQYPGTYLAHLHAGGSIDDWPTCKDHIDRTVERVIASENEMTPAELGWFGIGPKSGNYDGLQFDEIEYLMCKSLAYDAPISLQTSFSRMQAHPLTPDILEIVRQYETLRLSDKVTTETRNRLKQQGKDFVMLPQRFSNADDPPVFVPVEPLDKVAGTHDVRAFLGPFAGGTIATLWHFTGKPGKLRMNAPNVEICDIRGQSVQTKTAETTTWVPVSQRRMLLHFPGTSPGETKELLANATLEMRKPEIVWIQAEDFDHRVGHMAKGSAARVHEQGALDDVVLATDRFDRSGQDPCYCEYRVNVPRQGRWSLWARVRYPTGGDMSFGVVRPGDKVTLSGKQVLGNCGINDKQWHWTGRGGGVTTIPPGAPIVFDLEKGEFTFRVYPREGPGTVEGNPRLDCLCLAEDPDYRPTDEDARAALRQQE